MSFIILIFVTVTIKHYIMTVNELPEDAIEIEERYGRIYPLSEGYYGFIVGERPAMHVYQMKKYTIDIFKDSKFVNTIICEHGEF